MASSEFMDPVLPTPDLLADMDTIFTDAELNVFTENMLAEQGLTPYDLDIFSDAPTEQCSPGINTLSISSDTVQQSPQQAGVMPTPSASDTLRSREMGSASSAEFASGFNLSAQQQYVSGFDMPPADDLLFSPPATIVSMSTPPPLAADLNRSSGSGSGSTEWATLPTNIWNVNGTVPGFGTATMQPTLPAPANGNGHIGHDGHSGHMHNGNGHLASPQHTNGHVHNNGYRAMVLGSDDIQGDPSYSPGTSSGGNQDTSMGGSGSGGGAATSCGGSKGNLKPKRNRTAHTNAQRRYRERLRAKHEEADRRVEELTRELEELKTKQAALEQRNAALEQRAAGEGEGSPKSPRSMSAEAPFKKQESSGDTTANSGPVPVEETRSWRNRYGLNTTTWDLVKGALGAPDDRITFTVRPGPPLRLARREISEFTMAEYKGLWSDYVNAFATLLMEANGDVNSAAFPRLCQLLGETKALKINFCMMRPDLMSAYAAEKAAKYGMPTAAFWRAIADSMTISPEQMHKMMVLREASLHNLGALMAARREVLSDLTAGADPMPELQDMTSIDVLGTKSTSSRLDDLLRNENSFIAEVTTAAGAVLTPFQYAHVIVMAAPHGVNLLALLNIWCGRAGGLPLKELLRRGAAAGGNSLKNLNQVLADASAA